MGRGRLNIMILSYQYTDPHVKDKTVSDRLIFNMGIPIAEKDGLFIETGPSQAASGAIPVWLWLPFHVAMDILQMASGSHESPNFAVNILICYKDVYSKKLILTVL